MYGLRIFLEGQKKYIRIFQVFQVGVSINVNTQNIDIFQKI